MLTLDVMPIDAAIPGFSNRWYREALSTAVMLRVGRGASIRAITAPCFLGTKFEAFRGRGKNDYFSCPDLEDFVSVVDGRLWLLDEVRITPAPLRTYLAEAARSLLKEARFLDALPGYLLPDEASQARVGQIITKLERLESLGSREK